jgi:D-glycero-alpha-D-manno-heptose 1-phosphate guanylyltransferase
MITEAIILAGGLGTRLRTVVADVPKCMAPVAGKPFLHYVIQYLQQQGITKFIFSLGYKHELIEAYLQEKHPTLLATFAVEKEPLGTGGAIKLACSFATQKNVLVVNGDTFFEVDVKDMFNIHQCSLYPGIKTNAKF